MKSSTKSSLRIAAVTALVGVAAFSTSTAQAQDVRWSVTIGTPAPVYVPAPRPVVVYQQPQVVYQQPQVVYTQPQVVYTQPQVVYAPAPVVYAYPPVVYQQPRVVYQQPPVVVQPQQVIYDRPDRWRHRGHGHGHRGYEGDRAHVRVRISG
jgi:hypothetical protein